MKWRPCASKHLACPPIGACLVWLHNFRQIDRGTKPHTKIQSCIHAKLAASLDLRDDEEAYSDGLATASDTNNRLQLLGLPIAETQASHITTGCGVSLGAPAMIFPAKKASGAKL